MIGHLLGFWLGIFLRYKSRGFRKYPRELAKKISKNPQSPGIRIPNRSDKNPRILKNTQFPGIKISGIKIPRFQKIPNKNRQILKKSPISGIKISKWDPQKSHPEATSGNKTWEEFQEALLNLNIMKYLIFYRIYTNISPQYEPGALLDWRGISTKVFRAFFTRTSPEPKYLGGIFATDFSIICGFDHKV